MKYHFRVHEEDGEYWAECTELPSCLTQGKTREELSTNIQEALDLYLEDSTLPICQEIVEIFQPLNQSTIEN